MRDVARASARTLLPTNVAGAALVHAFSNAAAACALSQALGAPAVPRLMGPPTRNVQQQCAQPHRFQRHPLHEVVQPHPLQQRSLTGVAAHSQTKVGPSIAAPTSQEQQATLQVRTPKHATVSATFQHHRNTTQTASTGHSCLPAHLHQPTLHSSPQHDMGAGIFQQQLQAHTTGFTVS